MRKMSTPFDAMRGQRQGARGEAAMVLALMLAAFALRMNAIDRQSLWLDEGYSLWFARLELSTLWGDVARTEFNPPLFYILLKGWIALFGDSVAALRALPALVSTLTLPFVYLTARWTVGGPSSRTVALVAGLLALFSFSQLQYAQELRTYSLGVLAIAMTCAASVRILRLVMDRTDALELWPFALLGAGAALAVWSHFTMLVAIGLTGLFHIGFWLSVGERRLALFRAYLVSAGVFALLGGRAIWLLVAYAMPSSGGFWIAPPGLPDAIDASLTVFGAAYPLDSWSGEILLKAVLFAPWPVLGAWVAWRSGRTDLRVLLAFLLLVSLGSFATYLAISWLGKPIFLQRVVLPSQIGWLVLCALSVQAFSAVRLKQAMTGALLLVFASGAASYVTSKQSLATKEGWRQIAAEIADNVPAAGNIYTTASGELLLGYYLARAGRSDIELVSLNGSFRLPPQTPPFTPHETNFAGPPVAPAMNRLASDLASGRPVWLVVRNLEADTLAPVRATLAGHAASLGPAEIRQPGPITIYRPNTGTALASQSP